MRTLLKLDEKMLKEAKKLLGVRNTSEVVRLALADRISAEAQRRLAELGGSDPDFGKIKPEVEN